MNTVLQKYVTEFGEIRVSDDRRYIVTQHLKTNKHTYFVNCHQNAINSKIQQQVMILKKMYIFERFCKALLSANIPINKVNNKDFHLFMEKMVHITCFVHGVHRIAEEIKEQS